jgi:hypothetical protein
MLVHDNAYMMLVHDNAYMPAGDDAEQESDVGARPLAAGGGEERRGCWE